MTPKSVELSDRTKKKCAVLNDSLRLCFKDSQIDEMNMPHAKSVR